MYQSFTLKDQKELLEPLLLATLQDYEGITPPVCHPLSIGSKADAISLRHFGKGIPPHILIQDLIPEEEELVSQGDFICRYGIGPLIPAPKVKINSFHHRTNTVVLFEHGQLIDCFISRDVAPDGILIHAEWDGKETKVEPISEHDLVTALQQLVPAANLPTRLNVYFNSHPLWY